MSLHLTSEARGIYQDISNSFPPILRAEKMRRIDWLLGLMLAGNSITEADPEMVVTATKFISRPSQESRLDKMLAIGTPRDVVKRGYQSLEGYYNRPRQVKRWPPVPGRPEKSPQEMKVLAFCGSNRIGGNSDALITEALRGATEAGAQVVDKIYLANLDIKRCENIYTQRDIIGAMEIEPSLAPDYCPCSRDLKNLEERGYCTLVDDMPEIYQKLIAADAIILGFPIINGWEGVVVTNFLERWQRYSGCLISDRVGEGRRAMIIGTWGTNNTGAYDNIVEIVINRLNVYHYTVVEAISGCGFAGMLSGLDEEGKAIISRYPEEIEKAYQAGRNLVCGDA